MKLYTEEQVRKAYKDGNRDGFNHICISADYLNFVTPIELPSEEEIEEKLAFHAHGARWVINRIKQQDNGK